MNDRQQGKKNNLTRKGGGMIKGRGGDKRTMTKYTSYDASSHTLLTLANTMTHDVVETTHHTHH